MEILIPAGKYVIAVSGGVDSMVLLDVLKKHPGLNLVVAHFNHGIRLDAGDDEKIVVNAAKKHNLIYEIGHGSLGKNADESTARQARYEFLESIRKKHNAQQIITAHHQDDLIETAFINILRGTNHKGLVAISLNKNVTRPLLKVPKLELINYAQKNNIVWREDSTNSDTKYLRNYLRKNVTPKLSESDKQKLINGIEKVANSNNELNEIIATISHKIVVKNKIIRSKFASLPTEIGNELVVYWLRGMKLKDYDKKLIERLAIIIKTGRPNTKHNVAEDVWLVLSTKTAEFVTS